ncbi:TPA: acetylglutamate kinase [Staphylococcus aureus]|nr:acetylglutamate kinase [Staphylococcus aureus]HEJ7187951.1 acetylglutamate kinase [Staphylococcus aureus]HEJ7982364.1 acetylglutamate kinase [Staphylococcus aureus]HEJ8433819.1 acetylglutamate kinase [Staphylococcus aureus]
MKFIVIKIGGSTLSDMHPSIINNIKHLRSNNIYPIIVHGGGPFINEALSNQQIEPHFVNGLRVTDKATMTITKHTLIADVNTALVAQFNQHQCSAIGLCGFDAQLFEITSFDQQYGYVGVPTALNKDALQYLCTKFVPIINSIGFNNHDGEFYNINADTLAYFIASSLKAPIYVLSNIAGVLINDVVIPQLPLVDIHQYIEHGDIYGGMIPKVLDAKNAIENGCPKVIIASGNKPNIIESIYNNDFVGTTILNS